MKIVVKITISNCTIGQRSNRCQRNSFRNKVKTTCKLYLSFNDILPDSEFRFSASHQHFGLPHNGVGHSSEPAGQKREKNSTFERQNSGHLSDKFLTHLFERHFKFGVDIWATGLSHLSSFFKKLLDEFIGFVPLPSVRQSPLPPAHHGEVEGGYYTFSTLVCFNQRYVHVGYLTVRLELNKNMYINWPVKLTTLQVSTFNRWKSFAKMFTWKYRWMLKSVAQMTTKIVAQMSNTKIFKFAQMFCVPTQLASLKYLSYFKMV